MADLFNNREIATGIWLIAAIGFGARNQGIRESFATLPKSFCHWKIALPLAVLVFHVGCSVYVLHRLSLWNISFLKDTIYWFLFSGFVLFMNLMTNRDHSSFFRKTILDCFKVMVLIQFLINFYPLPLALELVLVPVLTFLVAASTYAESKKELSTAKKLFDGILTVIGMSVLIHVGRSIHLHYRGLLSLDVIRSMLLPLWLTLMLLPFLYISRVIADYEMLFVRLPYFVKSDDSLLSYVKRRIIMLCHFDLRKLSRFSKKHLTCLHSIEDRKSADQIFKNFQLGVVYNGEE